MAALQVVPIFGGAVAPSPIPVGAVAPAPHPLILYAIEEQLTAMADTAELVPEDQEQAFLEEFRVALTAAVEKRDRVGQFLAHLEQQAAFAKAEIARLQERKVFFEQAVEKMEGYVLLSIIFFACRDEFLGSRLVEESDAGAVHGEDGSDSESAV